MRFTDYELKEFNLTVNDVFLHIVKIPITPTTKCIQCKDTGVYVENIANAVVTCACEIGIEIHESNKDHKVNEIKKSWSLGL